ncbi:serine--tRNA ligase [Dehalococcoidia bacterium]|nr:serine--tRNA ligase [Dehalococcoidia bacterium]
MLSIQLIRQNPDLVREALAKRNDSAPLDEILAKDENIRRIRTNLEDERARINRLSEQIADQLQEIKVWEERRETYESAGRTGDVENCLESIAKLQTEIEEARTWSIEASKKIADLEPPLILRQKELNDLLLRIPNIPHPTVPLGKGEPDNVVVRSRGEPRRFDFKPKPHWELGEALGIIDFQRGVKLSGSRFYVLKGWGARLQRALIDFMLDLHVSKHGYTEIYPPFMVRRECMVGSGNLPKFADNLYHDQEDDFWFVPTAEVPLTNLYRGEILPPGTLPIYHVAFTTCFRREKMSAGKDTRGIKRGHQFDKVELYKFVEPDESDEELERMVEDAGAVCGKLGLPYRIVQLCTADLGFASAKSYDIEVWAPGCDEWLEVSSCSNCTDFQARRANVRYRPDPGAKPQFVHTLNGSGLALPRVLIAVLENYQQGDGSITVPDPLRPYLGTDVIR